MEQHYGQVLSHTDYLFLDSFFKNHFNDAFIFNLTRVHGFLSAIISSPTIVKPSDWTPVILGKEPEFDSIKQAEKVMELIYELFKQISRALRGVEPYYLLLWNGHEAKHLDNCPDSLIKDWCHGYLRGVKMDPLWETDSHAVAMLTPFSLFANLSCIKPTSFSYPSHESIEQNNQECMRQYRMHLDHFVEDNYAYWFSEREEEIRLYNENKKINSKCPCGSNKSFDECMCNELCTTH